MSLVKKNTGGLNSSKSRRSSQNAESSDPKVTKPSALFRKSASIDTPSSSDVERPPSQQSGRGNKKKIIPSFLSNLFSSGSKVTPEEKASTSAGVPKKISSSMSAGGDYVHVPGQRAFSSESLNSVLSSSSFSYVNPKSIGGKRVKGKRIPVDDPTYGSTSTPVTTNQASAATGATANGKNTDGVKKGFGNTLEKIGVKMGLKKKYNLQSCESLQYIDACDEPVPTSAPTPNPSSPSSVTSNPKITASSCPVAGNETVLAMEVHSQKKPQDYKESEGQQSILISSVTDAGRIDPALKFAVIKSSKISVKSQSHAMKYDLKKQSLPRPRHSEINVVEPVKQVAIISEAITVADDKHDKPSKSDKNDKDLGKKSTFKVESSVQTVIQIQTVLPQASTSASAVKTEVSEPIKENTVVSVISETKPKEDSHPVEPIQTNPAAKPEVSQPEAIPSTSKSLFLRDSSVPPAIPSTSKGAQLNSNTWGNSARRKRKAPQPPSAPKNEPILKLSNGLSTTHQPSIVTDLSNDVPTSSSPAAALTKFKRIDESPPPPVRSKNTTGNFEIRPRKKERSVEPQVRPTSSFATPSSSGTQTLLSTHHQRYQQHKRSSSEGLSNSNTNTRGRVHKAGKKKAPPPPNPFGDPDIPTEGPEVRESTSVVPALEPTPPETTLLTFPPTGIAQNPFEAEESVQNPPTSSITTESSFSPPAMAPSASSGAAARNLEPVTAGSNSNSSIVNTSTHVAVSIAVLSRESTPVIEDLQEMDEETRQNILNDQQERQQLGLSTTPSEEAVISVENPSTSPVTTASPVEVEVPVTPAPIASTSSATIAVNNSGATAPITENDIRAAHHSLQVLSSSVKNSSREKENQSQSQSRAVTTTPAADPVIKAQLLELKKEAELSPLNPTRNKSRPLSIGSAIYESIMGKASGSSSSSGNPPTGTGDGVGSSSPKVTAKPWYKNLPPYKSRHPPQIRPFTSLVKFSELDKEAARIVEENKRKSAATEERFLANAQDELDELFAGISDDETPTATARQSENVSPRASSDPKPESRPKAEPNPSQKLFTTAQVHPMSCSSGAGASTSENSSATPSTSLGDTGNATASASNCKKDGSSSPPTFQSVHAASKHRQIKPLLQSSPITRVRSEKLAIVQPQASAKKTEVKTSRESSSSESRANATTVTTPSAIPVTTASASIPSSSKSSVSTVQVSSASVNLTTSSSKPAVVVPSSLDSMWDCPRCTLKNPNWRSLCEACYYRKDPISTPSTGLISSIFQRVNAESNKIASAGTTTPVVPKKEPETTTPVSSSNASPPIVESAISSNVVSTSSVISPNVTTATVSCSSNATLPSVSSTLEPSTSSTSNPSTPPTETELQCSSASVRAGKDSSDIPCRPPPPPPCENFLSQLPTKQDASKEEKLHGMRLHEDPELEELDIGKLRKARLAYFQRRQSTDSIDANAINAAEPSHPAPLQTNDLGASSNTSNNTTSAEDYSNAFADNEDDFIDNLLGLDSPEQSNQNLNLSQSQTDDNIPTTIANIIAEEPPLQNENQKNPQENPSGTPLFLQSRYKPSLEAIREGTSQDYTYCYSPTEIAQIYENWQLSQEQSTGRIHNLPVLFHSQVQSQHAPNSYPQLQTQTHFLGGNHVIQPYANNRTLQLQDDLILKISSAEEKYMNTNTNTLEEHQHHQQHPTLCSPALNLHTPTLALNESAFTRNSPIPTLRLPFLPASASVLGQRQTIREDNISGASIVGHNYENNMNPGESSRKSYQGFQDFQEFQRMGLMGSMPHKGYQQNEGEWSSESSGDTDSSRGFWGRRPGPVGPGYMDSLPFPGMSRRSTLDFSSEPYPDATMAVAKLMKRLEAAIANGDHRLAATLAHDLALMKVNCVVAKINQPFSIRVYVEDRFMQQGPFLVQVSSMMTVRDLKGKIESDWGIPSGFQKWILGQKMAEDDNLSLTSFELVQNSMAFLFLVTPADMGKSKGKSEAGSVSGQVPSVLNAPGAVSQVSPATVIDPVTLHAYECVDERPVYNNLDGGKTAPKKASSAAQTTSTIQSQQLSRRESSPPPLPSKSPIPQKSSQTASTSKQLSLSSAKSTKQDVVIKEINTKPPMSPATSEHFNAATAITLSLQQKLQEFKAVAEQTFSKAGIPMPSTSSSGNTKLVKEPSPGPSSSAKILNIRSTSQSPNLRRHSDSKESKGSAKTSAKSQLTPSSSKEKLSGSKPGSTEKLNPKNLQVPSKKTNQERPITPENRFNGILLPTCDDTKPPEVPEKTKKTIKDGNRAISPPDQTASPGSSQTPTGDNSNINSKKPPVPPTTQKTEKENTKPADEGHYAIPSGEEQQAPQPTPRGLKRQVTSPEKVNKDMDLARSMTPPVTGTKSERPTPTPRTLSSLRQDSTGATRESQRSPTPKQPSVPQTESNPLPSQNEYCQTTLPFPAPKSRVAAGGTGVSNTITPLNENSSGATTSSVSPLDSANKGLLRPSAFVMQMKSEGTNPEPLQASAHGNSVFLSALTGNLSTNSSNSPKPPYFGGTTSTSNTGSKLTAYVSPSPSTSSNPSNQSSTAVTVPPKQGDNSKKEDSAQSYLEMLEMMEKQDLISTSQDSECPVCFASVPKGEGVILRDCLHVFCKECLVGCVEYADDSTVKCPYRDNDYACNYNLQEREIKALVPPEVFEKYLARSVKLAESKIVNTFHCKTPDCTGWCVFEDDVNLFLCPVCKKRNCLTCQAIHEGVDCLKFQRELAIAAETDEDAKQSRLMLEKMIQRGEALECPACHVVLLKKWGCDWVRCSYCKTEICWVTKGLRWGKGGKGDISGGCKCGVNGVRCHPKCTYCH